MTVPAAIRELEKIELIRRKGGSYRLDHAVSKRQKVILSSFGINADDISIISIEIDKLLKDSQSLMDSDEENSLSARLFELQKTKQEIEAKKVMDAFRKSGKSMQELMTFLEV